MGLPSVLSSSAAVGGVAAAAGVAPAWESWVPSAFQTLLSQAQSARSAQPERRRPEGQPVQPVQPVVALPERWRPGFRRSRWWRAGAVATRASGAASALCGAAAGVSDMVGRRRRHLWAAFRKIDGGAGRRAHDLQADCFVWPLGAAGRAERLAPARWLLRCR